jgi:hypothetical protein
VFFQFLFRCKNCFADVTLPGSGGAPVEVVLQVFGAKNRLLTDGTRELFVMFVSEKEENGKFYFD